MWDVENGGVMKLIVREEIWERFPGMEIAIAVARGVDNTVPRPSIASYWRAAWDGAAAQVDEYDNAQSHPSVAAWREAFRNMGLARATSAARSRRCCGGPCAAANRSRSPR